MSGTPTMKVMLKDMFEFIDAIADIQDIHHDESLEKLQKKSNHKFLGFNMYLMMTVIKDLIDDKDESGDPPEPGEVSVFDTLEMEENEKLKAENEKLKKLKEEHTQYRMDIDELKDELKMSKLVHHQNMGLSEDLKKLKEENEKLKAELNDFTSVFDGNVSMIKMKKENQKLTDENKDLNSQWAKKRDEDGDSYRIIINELKEELNESQKAKLCLREERFNMRPRLTMIIREVREENKKLKEQLNDFTYVFDENINLMKMKDELREAKTEIVKLNSLLETTVNCCDCGESESHKKTKWTYCTEDTDTYISKPSPVWCCDQCLDKDD